MHRCSQLFSLALRFLAWRQGAQRRLLLPALHYLFFLVATDAQSLKQEVES